MSASVYLRDFSVYCWQMQQGLYLRRREPGLDGSIEAMSRRVKSSAEGYLLGVWQQESFGLFHVPLKREN